MVGVFENHATVANAVCLKTTLQKFSLPDLLRTDPTAIQNRFAGCDENLLLAFCQILTVIKGTIQGFACPLDLDRVHFPVFAIGSITMDDT